MLLLCYFEKIRKTPLDERQKDVGQWLAVAEKSIVPNGLCPLIRHGLARDTFPQGGRLFMQKPKEASPLGEGFRLAEA